MSELKNIPNIGKATERDMIAINKILKRRAMRV